MTARKSLRYLSYPEAPMVGGDELELDEADVWSAKVVGVLPESRKHAHHQRRPQRLKSSAVDNLPKSLPVNIPDWSKILGGEYRRRTGECNDEDEDEGNDRMPPHEYLARTRGASFSVHEGAGRTLKGRDLDRVRNAIWKQIGFED